MKSDEFAHATGTKTYYPVLMGLVGASRPYQYFYMPRVEFDRLTDVPEMMRVYWFEIFERAHCAAIAAIVRLERWLDAMRVAAELENFLGFAASFRGLLESAADTRYALGDVPEALASTFAYAYKAIRGKATVAILAPDLENDLIHFLHGRKLKSNEDAPESHAARTMREYLDALQGAAAGPLHQCYRELCNVTHPAADSVLYLLEKDERGTIRFRNGADEAAIQDLCARSGTVVTCAVSESLVYPLLILRILNRLEVPELRTAAAEDISLEDVSSWQEIEAWLRDAD